MILWEKNHVFEVYSKTKLLGKVDSERKKRRYAGAPDRVPKCRTVAVTEYVYGVIRS